jgi:hypothetical protein
MAPGPVLATANAPAAAVTQQPKPSLLAHLMGFTLELTGQQKRAVVAMVAQEGYPVTQICVLLGYA